MIYTVLSTPLTDARRLRHETHSQMLLLVETSLCYVLFYVQGNLSVGPIVIFPFWTSLCHLGHELIPNSKELLKRLFCSKPNISAHRIEILSSSWQLVIGNFHRVIIGPLRISDIQISESASHIWLLQLAYLHPARTPCFYPGLTCTSPCSELPVIFLYPPSYPGTSLRSCIERHA